MNQEKQFRISRSSPNWRGLLVPNYVERNKRAALRTWTCKSEAFPFDVLATALLIYQNVRKKLAVYLKH
ncbi:hypothetical protein ACS0TY_033996 [Phlomoides rotata]